MPCGSVGERYRVGGMLELGRLSTTGSSRNNGGGEGGEAARLFPASDDIGKAVPVGTSRLVAAARDVSGCGSTAQGCLAGARTGVQHRRRCCGSAPLWSRCLNP